MELLQLYNNRWWKWFIIWITGDAEEFYSVDHLLKPITQMYAPYGGRRKPIEVSCTRPVFEAILGNRFVQQWTSFSWYKEPFWKLSQLVHRMSIKKTIKKSLIFSSKFGNWYKFKKVGERFSQWIEWELKSRPMEQYNQKPIHSN